MVVIEYKFNLTDEIFQYTHDSLIKSVVRYIIDHRYRKSVMLTGWIKQQVINPDKKVKELCDKISSSNDYDVQMNYIYNYVKRYFKYVSDTILWDINEKWQTASESVKLMKGDCEDGSILMYVLARLKGIPANRLMIFCGDVQAAPTAPSEGHCWLAYKPKAYPLNFVFVDWCYYPPTGTIKKRNKFFINLKTIHEYKLETNGYRKTKSKYKKIWFGFNEDASHSYILK